MSDVTQSRQKSFRSQIAKLDFVHEQRVKLYAELVQTGYLVPELCRLVSMYVGVVFQIYRRKRQNGRTKWKCSVYIAGNSGRGKVYDVPPVPGIPSIPRGLLINGGECYYDLSQPRGMIGNIHRQITDVHINHVPFGNGMELISWYYANELIDTGSKHVLMQNGKQVPLVILLQIPDELTNKITSYNSHGTFQTQTLLTTIYIWVHPSFSVRYVAAKFNIGIVTYCPTYDATNMVYVRHMVAIQLPDTPNSDLNFETTRVV